MFSIILKGKVENVVKGKDFKNKETGEVRPGVIKLQFLAINEVKGIQTIDVSVPQEFESKAFELNQKEVELPVELFAKNSQIYYRVKSL